MYLLGLSCFYHDSAVCLLRDGVPIAAVSEQAFSRKKHDSDFPVQGIRWALKQAGIRADQLDGVAFYDKPLLKFDRLLRYQMDQFPGSFGGFVESMPRWIGTRLRLRKLLTEEIGYGGPVLYSEHHLSHAASAYYTSGFEHAAVLTVDGVGEWTTCSRGVGEGHTLTLLDEIRFPHSLGLLYSAMTFYCGFKVNSAEYKLMGLAPYGEPTLMDEVRQLIDVKDDGSFRLNMQYFAFEGGAAMFTPAFERLMGAPKRPLGDGEMEPHYKNAARSIQELFNEVMVKLAVSAMDAAGSRKLCMAGGVALNCVANGHILRQAKPDQLYIQPAAGDAGGAMGAALVAWHQLLENPQGPRLPTPYLGPGYSEDEVRATLDRYGAVYRRLERDELIEQVATLLDTAHVVGWYQGRMEWGPRALGHRSILGDARHPEMRSIINMRIKFREGFRPFAPSCVESAAEQYFEIDRPSPYMLLVAPVKQQHRQTLQAITHVDGSARLQTVSPEQEPLYHDLIQAFGDKTGCPIVINTSLNVRGEPIVNTPEDAYLCFMRTKMDAMALGPFLCLKPAQPKLELASAAEAFGYD